MTFIMTDFLEEIQSEIRLARFRMLDGLKRYPDYLAIVCEVSAE